MYTVYVLFSEKHNKHYTGFTSDYKKRFISHNELGIKDWTTRYRQALEKYSHKRIFRKEGSDEL